MRIGDTIIAQFARRCEDPDAEGHLPITAAQLGSADMTTLTIDVDRTFVPGGPDARTLGIRVFHTSLDVK